MVDYKYSISERELQLLMGQSRITLAQNIASNAIKDARRCIAELDKWYNSLKVGSTFNVKTKRKGECVIVKIVVLKTFPEGHKDNWQLLGRELGTTKQKVYSLYQALTDEQVSAIVEQQIKKR